MVKKLPIVFVIDISGSMEAFCRMLYTNQLIRAFIANSGAEFNSKIVMNVIKFNNKIYEPTGWLEPDSYEAIEFTPEHQTTTHLYSAALKAYELIEQYTFDNTTEEGKIGFYLPHIVIITDGRDNDPNGKEAYKQLLKKVAEHSKCDAENASKLIAPYIMYVGNENENTINTTKEAVAALNTIAKPYVGSAFCIDDQTDNYKEQFSDVFDIITYSVHASSTSRPLSEIYKYIKEKARKKAQAYKLNLPGIDYEDANAIRQLVSMKILLEEDYPLFGIET